MNGVSKTGYGTISKIDPTLPFLEYEYPYTDKNTGEKIPSKCHFASFTKEARKMMESPELKLGEKVTCVYVTENGVRTLESVELQKKRQGGFQPRPTQDPAVEMARIRANMQSEVLKAASDLVKFAKSENWTEEEVSKGWTIILEMTEFGVKKLLKTPEYGRGV